MKLSRLRQVFFTTFAMGAMATIVACQSLPEPPAPQPVPEKPKTVTTPEKRVDFHNRCAYNVNVAFCDRGGIGIRARLRGVSDKGTGSSPVDRTITDTTY